MRASGTHDETSRALLRLAANYRLEVLRPRMASAFGLSVVSGLFAGMRLLPHASEGCFIPKLLGCYESPLQPSLRSMLDVGYDVVLNVGCAEGYYAVGLARLLPAAEIFAYDIDPAARALCGELAALNGVADRVVIAGAPGSDTFTRHGGRRVLLVCDIEGGEVGLLDPAAQPSLLEFDLVVEAHNGQGPVSAVLISRFAATHRVTVLNGLAARPTLPTWFDGVPEIDQLLSVWEMRRSATPWLVMIRQSGGADVSR